MPEAHWDATAGKIKDEKALAAYVNEHVAFKAAEDVKRLSNPASPDAYKVELPKDFKPPEGVEFKFRDNDPLLAQAKTMAHEMGISQENFSRLLGLYAGAQVADQATITNARNAEIAKLGAAGTARVTAVTTFFKAMLGDQEGAQFSSRMFTARDVEIAEKLITRFSSQGGAPFNGGGRTPPDVPGRVDSATYDKMTYTEKKEYTARFPQTNGAAA